MTIRSNGGVFGRNPEFQTATIKGDLTLTTALQFVGGARLTSTSTNLVVDKNMLVNGIRVGRANGSASETNTVLGFAAMSNASYTGTESTAIGWGAMFLSTGNSYQNVAMGHSTLFANTSGFGNTAVGVNAGGANTSGSTNTYVGIGAGGITTGSNNIVIGANAAASATTVSNETTIGNSSTTKTRIFGDIVLANGGAVSTVSGAIASLTSGVAATMFTLSGTVPSEGWIVSSDLQGEATTSYQAVYLVSYTSSNVVTITQLVKGNLASITASGLNIQYTQGSGGTKTNNRWSAVRIF